MKGFVWKGVEGGGVCGDRGSALKYGSGMSQPFDLWAPSHLPKLGDEHCWFPKSLLELILSTMAKMQARFRVCLGFIERN